MGLGFPIWDSRYIDGLSYNYCNSISDENDIIYGWNRYRALQDSYNVLRYAKYKLIY